MENSLNQVIVNYNTKNSLSFPSSTMGVNTSSSEVGPGWGSVTGGTSTGNLGKIIDILNEHHTVLGWLDMKSRLLQKELQLVNRELSSVTSYD